MLRKKQDQQVQNDDSHPNPIILEMLDQNHLRKLFQL